MAVLPGLERQAAGVRARGDPNANNGRKMLYRHLLFFAQKKDAPSAPHRILRCVTSTDAAHGPTNPTIPTIPTTRTAAPTWEDGLIAGSGRVGAIVFGASSTQTVSLAHERSFLPLNPRPAAPLLAPSLAAIQERVLAGDGEGAGRLMAAAAEVSGFERDLVWTDPLGICATLDIDLPADGGPTRRRIDPAGGTVSLHWDDDDLAMHLVAPRDHEEVWIAIECGRDAEARLRLGLAGADATPAGPTWAPAYGDRIDAVALPGAVGELLTSARADGAAIASSAVDSGTPWEADPTGTTLSTTVPLPAGARSVIRVSATAGPREGAAPASPFADWDAVVRHQERAHGDLVLRSVLDLSPAQSHAAAEETTEETWGRAREGDAGARRRVLELAYLSGRANAIAATGELPPTLQGVWQGTWTPAWSADYTMNGNVQNGGIASLLPTGTPELARSLLDLVLPHLDDYRANARRVFGAEGMLLPARMSTHGRANHFSPDFPHVFWVGGGGWALRIAADLVSITGDPSYASDALWELAVGVLEFAETGLLTAGGDAHLVPGYSPENAPDPAGSPIASDPTMDVAILRDAARCTAVIGRARGDDSLAARWRAVLDRLPSYRVADDGTLAEWLDPRWPENHAHRHASQLYPLWYEVDEAFRGDGPEAVRLRDAALRAVERRIAWRAEDPTAPPGRMEMAFGLVQLGLAAAALGDAGAALRCAEWLAVDHWTPALTTRHDAGRIFNLDASGGLPALVAAMLLGSDQDAVTLFPALPADWADGGSITGLTARGAVIVDRLEWDAAGARATLRRRTAARPLRISLGSGFRIAGEASIEVELGPEPLSLVLERRV